MELVFMIRLMHKISELHKILKNPQVTIYLLEKDSLNNDLFYQRITKDFYDSTCRRHSRFPIVRNLQYGVAICQLPKSFDEYWMMIEASVRRNCKKATRLLYRFEKINYNDHLKAIAQIQLSTDYRQGKKVPDHWGEVKPCTDPPSSNSVHDYVWYGIIGEEGLVAYASCFICGQIGMVEHILGHDKYISDGIVPLLITGMAKDIIAKYTNVKYYAYGTFWGAEESMRRFKKKFKFMPHKVRWELGSPMKTIPDPLVQNRKQLIYRTKRDTPFSVENNEMQFHFLQHIRDVFTDEHLVPMKGLGEKMKLAVKICSGRRYFYYVTQNGQVLHTAWVSLGFCRHYCVAKTDTVIGPIWTTPAGRNMGVATFALKMAINFLIHQGKLIFYIDTSEENISCQKVISNCGFGAPINHYEREKDI